MGIISRILGLPRTKTPADPECWNFESGRIEVFLDRAGELNSPGGALRLEGRGLPVRVLVFKGEDEAFHALPNKCTHAGRRLDPLPGSGGLECCSVSKSTFSYEGDKTGGPAKGPVGSFPVAQQDGRLIIDLSSR